METILDKFDIKAHHQCSKGPIISFCQPAWQCVHFGSIYSIASNMSVSEALSSDHVIAAAIRPYHLSVYGPVT